VGAYNERIFPRGPLTVVGTKAFKGKLLGGEQREMHRFILTLGLLARWVRAKWEAASP